MEWVLASAGKEAPMSQLSQFDSAKFDFRKRSRWTWIQWLAVAFAVIGVIVLGVVILLPPTLHFSGDGPEIHNINDLHQLESAVGGFHRDFKLGTEYFPSRIVLCERYSEYLDNINKPQYRDSLGFVQRMFPRLWKDAAAQEVVVDWNGNGNPNGVVDAPTVLEGDQCLVFFLGGIPDNRKEALGCLGFSVDPKNPAAKEGRCLGPYYAFEPYRLVRIHGNQYWSYLDVYKKKPYAYFSSYSTRNGYDRYGSTDCPTLGVWPYAKSVAPTVQYVYPDKFQVISAGADQVFGPGTDLTAKQPLIWTPETAGHLLGPGQDDQSNFHTNFLGVPLGGKS
jgi:hypothetical protein